MAEEVIGSGFTQGVSDQLIARENFISAPFKDNQKLKYFNSNNVWVRLSSSVNTATPFNFASFSNSSNGIRLNQNQPDTGDSKIAQANVLNNGTSSKGGIDTDNGFNPITRPNDNGTVEQGVTRTASYQNYSSLGFRPKPGITAVAIKSKNTYGTLREAEVSLTVWTLEDLELIQTLYLRPGYSVLLEWGHTLWINENNEISSQIKDISSFVKNKMTQSSIEAAIKDNREKSNYNYDAMFGFISNFSWSFRNDGGYDCTVKIVSKGAILESISASFEPKGRLPNTKFRYSAVEDASDSTRELGKVERISIYHKFIQELINPDNRKIKIYTRETLNDKYAKDFKNRLRPFFAYDFLLDINQQGNFFDKDIAAAIVPLYTVLDIFNNFISPITPSNSNQENKNLVKFYIGQTDRQPLSGPYEKTCKYITSDNHFSIDPVVCMLPKVPKKVQGVGDDKISTPGLVNIEDRKITNSNLEQNIGKVKGETDDILNIYVGLYPILQRIKNSIDENGKPDKSIYQIIEQTLEDINSTLGGVNELDIHYDEDDNMYYVVDRKLTPTRIQNTSKINLTGLKSTITNLDISSKISPDILNMISIAAQGTSGNSKDSVGALLDWNKGLIDRHFPSKTQTREQATDTGQDRDRLLEFLKEVKDTFDDLSSTFLKAEYNKDAFDNLRQYHKEFSNKFVIEKYFNTSGQNKTKPVPGLIPIELSFDTIGIGGLKIGQAFRVSKGILPTRYTDNFGFLITGLDHSLQNSKWITSIKTQFFSIDK